MNTQQYQLIDSGNFRKLEQVGSYRLIRPAAQAFWRPALPAPAWQQADAEFVRRGSSDGDWRPLGSRKLPTSWTIQNGEIQYVIKTTDFGHLGIFPEHMDHWSWIAANVARSGKPTPRILNLFAYTGGMSLYSASLGCQVVHVDASRTSVEWARENSVASKLQDKPIRWMTDDVLKFVKREVKRSDPYDGIILDPPSFGRGPKGETWKIEEHLPDLLSDLAQILDKKTGFCLLSCHTPGYSPLALKNLLMEAMGGDFVFDHGEMSIRPEEPVKLALPSGFYCRLETRR